MNPEQDNSPELEALVLQGEEGNDNLESIEANTGAVAVNGKETNETLKDIEQTMETRLVQAENHINKISPSLESLGRAMDTVDTILSTLRGPQGEKGEDSTVAGPEGPKGKDGKQGPTGPEGPKGEDGKDGKDGAKGPKGPKGEKGDKGDPGVDGKDGKDAVVDIESIKKDLTTTVTQESEKMQEQTMEKVSRHVASKSYGIVDLTDVDLSGLTQNDEGKYELGSGSGGGSSGLAGEIDGVNYAVRNNLFVPYDDKYVFDGESMYATMPAYTTLGDPAKYRTITYEADAGGANVIDDSAEPISEFGRVSTNYHGGNLYNLSIVDNSPIQNSSVVMGNSSRYATLDTEIVLTADFTIEFNIIRQNSSAGTAFQTYLSSNTSALDTFFVYDTAHATFPNTVSMRGSGGLATFGTGAWFDDYPPGQHVKVKINRTGGTTKLYLDDVEVSSVATVLGSIKIDTLLVNNNRSTRPFKAGCAMQDLQITDGTNTYLYALDEASGTQIVNGGNTGVSYYGDWTDGTWTVLPPNSRFYPIRDGSTETLTESIAGEDATIVNFQRKNWKSVPLKTAIHSKPAGEPILLVFTGQSNALGSICRNPFTQNPNVLDLATQGTSTPQNLANLAWALPVMDTGSVKGDLDANSPYVGYSNARRGSIGLACANALQLATGRDVYVVQSVRAGWAISNWASPSGAMFTSLNEAVAFALATPELAGLTGPDAVIWMQGETDASGGTTPAAYSTAWRDWRTAIEAIWSIAGKTEYYICELTQAYNRDGSTAFGTALAWDGIDQTVTDSDSHVHLISSIGLPEKVGNEIHYTGNANNAMGERVANKILYGEF